MIEPSPKAQLREQVRSALLALSVEQHAALSSAIMQRLAGLALFQQSKNILLYFPLRGEPNLFGGAGGVRGATGQIFLPRFNPESSAYEAALCVSREQLVRGAFGVWEPGAGCPSISLNQLDFVLVPGIAFDLAGRRLGRGKGFYDRLLAQVRGHKCGVAFDAQIVSQVPEEPHDVRVDSILTPTRWHSCQRAA